MMSSNDMNVPNPAESWVNDMKDVQQPNEWLAHVKVSGTEAVNALLKEAWEIWLTEAKAASSPLLGYGMTLIDANGEAIAEWRREGVYAHAESIGVAVYSRNNKAEALAQLRLYTAVREEWIHALLQASVMMLREIYDHASDLLAVKQLMNQQKINDKEARGRDNLFKIAKRLHDQNDVHSVLHVMLEDIEQMYPDAEVNLYLSQDFVDDDTRVKPLLLRHASDDLNANAFLSGKPVSAASGDDRMMLAIPMRGKQAVYGVLSLNMRQKDWDEFELHSMLMLADTAGSAFENAKLFEQSNLLIGELQLINELTKRLNQSLRLSEIFEFAMSELLQIFQADYCNLLRLNKDGNSFEVVASNFPGAANEACSIDNGFCGIVYNTKEPIIISDYSATRVVESRLMNVTGSRSLIAAPVMAGTDVVGVIMVSHQSPNYFSYENYKLLQVLSTHIGLAISNASLHAEVRRMVITDNLTGLHARHYLNEQIHSRQRKDRCGSLVLVDIDHFKKVNDTYGHLIGDSILVVVSDAIRSSIRDSDIAARWGGEELAVYLPQIRSEQAYRIAERIRSSVETGTNPGVTVSCGISEWNFEEEKISVESLFNRADMALYEAKKKGRNCIVLG